MKIIEDRSVVNKGIITGDVNTGDIGKEKLTKKKNKSKTLFWASIISGIIVALGTIMAAFIKN